MYIAGLNIPLSPPQWLEVFVVLTTADYFRYTMTTMKKLTIMSESKGGPIKPESLPSGFLGRIITPFHGFFIFVPPLIYAGALALNRFQPTEWMAKYALPADMVDSTWRDASRIGACVVSYALESLMTASFNHLGEQWTHIGRRQKSRVVKTGPYAWVRHPVYSFMLLQEALWSIIFWSWLPLTALGITAFAFAIKMPIEEGAIEKDTAVRGEYQRYVKQVPARLIPYIW